jgi:UDP-glucose 4-epimerase
MKPTAVLVTGGAGFIGANLVRVLLDKCYAVTVLDDFSVGSSANLRGLDLNVVEGDVRDLALLRLIVARHDAVVHLAAQTGVPASIDDPLKDCDVNVRGTLNVLEACRTAARGGAATPRVVFASSNAPLGRQGPPASEGKAPLPVSPYGASKLAGEGYCLAYHGAWQVPTVVLRFANVYGPVSQHKTSVIASFIKSALAGKPIEVHGDGEQTRDFLFVGDLCNAIAKSLDSEVAGEVFQVATGVETSIQEAASLCLDIVGKGVEVRNGPEMRGDIRRNYSDVSKVRQFLGWRPTVEFAEGLRRTVGWYKSVLPDQGAPLARKGPSAPQFE